MSITEETGEILVHDPSLKPKPDNAPKPPAKKNLPPPTQQVIRPAAGATPDVIRHKPRQTQAAAPASPASTDSNPTQRVAADTAEIAAANARARAAVAQQREQASRKVPQIQKPATLPERALPSQPQRSSSPPSRQTPPTAANSAQQKEAPARPQAQSNAPTHTEARTTVPSELPPPPQQREQRRPAATAEPRAKRESGKDFLLHTHGLRKVYDGRAVVNGVDVTVRPSEIVGLLGPNGAGKTTSFYMIVGLVQPNGGSVTFNGEDATNEPMYRRARLGMGYLPQEESIFRKLTVEENILAVMETQDIPRSERRDRCHELMKRFGIEKLYKNEAITLSGGEKRRLTIARSLVTNPKLLMLDEPFSGVDPIAVGEIQDIVRSLREQGLAILITDHNVRETLGIVDRAYLLVEGKVIREGTRDFLMNDELSRKLYLGEEFSM